MKGTAAIVAALMMVGVAIRATAQDSPYPYPAPPPAPTGQVLAPTQLDQLLGPIALYPDPLIAQLLPAATQPSQLVLAANYIAQGGDPNGIDQQPWDSSVKALAHYPQVLNYLESNLSWTSELGEAFLAQPADVMNSIQRLRAEAASHGNLQSSPQQTVVNDDGEIDIDPANPDMLYVPQYDPSLVYYQNPYYGGNFITFGVGFGIGGWLDHDFNWRNHNIITWGRDHPRPGGFWQSRPVDRQREFAGHATVWRPEARRPVMASANRGGDRGYENRDVHAEPAHQVPVHQVPVHQAPAQHAPEPVHTIPFRPTVSAFNSSQSAPEARASSSRGSVSRQAVSRPSSPAPASHPSGGGGGGEKRR